MTTQACNLAGRLPAGPIYVQRMDGTAYCEADQESILRMIKAEIVEGVGPSSGVIKRLRMLVTETEGMERMKAIPLPQKMQETPGAITSMASREVFREALDNGYFAWCHKANRNLSGVAA